MTQLIYYKKKFFFLFLTIILIFSTKGYPQQEVKVYEENWTIPGYKFPVADVNPMFFKGEAYQGASKVIYPYQLLDNIIREKEVKTLKTVILENEYVKVCITPEIGGKIYYATDKTNGYNFVYKNNSFKPANVGMTGAWVSGGIEWDVIHHHRASTSLPTDYSIEENTDGSKTVWVGETEPRQRMRWTVGVTVFPGKSYIQAEVKIHNRTTLPQTFLYWANVATHSNENYQILFPPSTQYTVYHAKNSFAHWPIANEIYNDLDYGGNIDLSWWKNHPEPNSFFVYDLQENFMGGYDYGCEAGTVHVGDHNIVKGAKLWEWGSGEKGKIWDKALTDKDGSYVEIMVGAFSDNQPDYSWIKPFEVKSFKQYWFPVNNTGGFKNANLDAAVNLDAKGNNALLAYYATAKHLKSKVVLEAKGQPVFTKEIAISPEKAFSEKITLAEGISETDLKSFLIDLETQDTLISYQPHAPKYIAQLPPVVVPPHAPSEIATTEELLLIGKRIQQFHNATVDPMAYYNEALRRDPGDIRTNIALGTTALKNLDYALAKKYLRSALKRLTHNYTRPESCEALYLLGIALKNTGEYKSAVDTLYRATWDYTYHSAAYDELSKISCIQNNYQKALDQISESLATNARNNSAISLKAGILRRLGKDKEAIDLLDSLLKSDPLDFYALYERCLASEDNNLTLDEFKTRMRGYDQNYLELATEYIDIADWKELPRLLNLYLGETDDKNANPLVYYYLGYAYNKMGNKEKAADYFRKASSMSTDYCFPYRFETIPVLKTALEYNQQDAKPYYYLGNLLYDHQPKAAINNWEKAVSLDPAFAIAYRNLGWGYNHTEGNLDKAIEAYEKALKSNQDDPMYYAELDALYELNNSGIEKRVNLFNKKHDIAFKRGNSFYRETLVLNLSGKYQDVIKYQKESKFQIREGENHLRETNVDAHLLYGQELLKQGKAKDALNIFLAAHFMPGANMDPQLGDDNRTPQIDYYVGLTYEILGNKKKSNEYYSHVIDKEPAKDDFIRYYKGIALLKTGEKQKANALFNDMIAEGEKLLNLQEPKVDFFAKYGKKQADNQRKSTACLLKGLGMKGLGQNQESKKLLKQSLEHYSSSLWAKAELE